ncbi:hypothetical protein ACWEKM_45185 [Streptomyces sp. NPDC004752]
MRVSAAVVAVWVLVGCSGSSELEPVVGQWTAVGPQPAGYTDFADRSTIRVGKDGKATLGTSPMNLCGGAAVEEFENSDEEGKAFRISFPEKSPCVTVEVPTSLDVVVDDDSMTATPTGSSTPIYHFRRAE